MVRPGRLTASLVVPGGQAVRLDGALVGGVYGGVVTSLLLLLLSLGMKI